MSVSGNQRTRPSKSSNRTIDVLVSPVDTNDMAEFIGLGTPLSVSDEALIEGLLLASCQYYVDYYLNELLSRDYTLKFDAFPRQQEAFSGLGASPAVSEWWIDVPMWPVSAVDSVTVDGSLLVLDEGYTVDLDSKPSRIDLSNCYGENIVISYAAGYEKEAIPPQVITGIQLMTSYLYDHRGSCDASAAATDSGAATMWQSTKMYLSL